jgi:3-dehydroquinate synthase
MSETKIFLSDLSGSGGLAVGQSVAARLQVPFIDLAAEVAKRVGVTPTQVTERRGEPVLWAIEREIATELAAGSRPCVVGFTNDTVLARPVRRALLRTGFVVTLDGFRNAQARPTDAAVSAASSAGQVGRQILADVGVDRAAAYAECHACIDTTSKSPQSIVQEVVQVSQDKPVVVPLGERTYRVYVGSGIRTRLADHVQQACYRNSPVVVVTDQGVEIPWAVEARDRLASGGRRVVFVCLPAGESAKQLGSVEAIWNAALEGEVDRGGLVVGVGGGVVGDLSGFAAATLLRGIALGHLPTTLLAMVDSAIGGKTGFDTRHGKNLIGAFYQPRFVLSDIDTLRSLPLEEVRAGLAEVVKSAWLDGESSVVELERDAQALISRDKTATVRAIRMAAGLKARIVTEDERESDRRQLLNFGHTVGHAIEASLGYQGMRHGEAVSLGMIAAFRLAVVLGRAGRGQAERLERLLCVLGLPVNVRDYLSESALSFIGSDKKRRARTVNFVIPGDPGEVEVIPLELTEIVRVLREHA